VPVELPQRGDGLTAAWRIQLYFSDALSEKSTFLGRQMTTSRLICNQPCCLTAAVTDMVGVIAAEAVLMCVLLLLLLPGGD
jgi:hypothetical protein